MALEYDFLEMATDIVRIAPYTGRSADTVPTYGTDMPYRAYVERKNRHVLTTDKGIVVSTLSVHLLDPAPNLTTKDRLTMADGTQPVILSTAEARDHKGQHHWTVYT